MVVKRMFVIEEIPLKNELKRLEIDTFLRRFQLKLECDIDYTLVILENKRIVATASKAQNVLKCFAVDPDYRGGGLAAKLVSSIEDRMLKEGLYHFFIFTKTCEKEKFLSMGYQEIENSDGVTILEKGERIDLVLHRLKEKYHLDDRLKAAIVMNANPFTLGHRYLIEQASKENEQVLVFVVQEERSTFPFHVRFSLIKEGVRDLKNVTILESGPYIVSRSTFPSYFLKDDEDAITAQTNLDCQIFSRYYKEIFKINKRYIGTEPLSQTTERYNEAMLKILPNKGIDVQLVERLDRGGDVISASTVRRFLREGRMEELKELLPKSTYRFLQTELARPIIQSLQEKITRH